MKKTKILAIGDIHGDKGLVKKLAEKAKKENVDLIIIAGDLTWLEQPAKNIIEPLNNLGKKILLIPGNHETIPTIKSFENKYPNVKNIHGDFVKEGNLGIFGAGYATTVGPFWIEEKELFGHLKRSHEKIKDSPKTIMVTHMHHRGGKAEFSGFIGSKAVKRAVEEFKPDILISAHIHEAGGLEEKKGKTKIINVSRKAKVFEI
jgi:Icc-related predicted phosphoesterase